ncbi:hypothetical protein [Streptomyces albogriseolus]|uniref:hypothetical protein n=1 Tax=Streptomyces albogriseolus TaxID=1887 RepID=UPI0033AC8C53
MSNEHPTPPPQQPPGAPGPYGPPTAHPPYGQQPYAQPGAQSPYGQSHAQPGAQSPYSPYGQPHAQPGAQSPYSPYGQPHAQPGAQSPYSPYGQPHAQPGAQSPYGRSPYGQPHGWPGAAPTPYAPVPAGMPGPVRAAQIVIFATFGIGVLLTVLVAAGAGAEASGRFFGGYLMPAALFVLAFRFPTAGNGVRVASIVLACLQILFALGGAARGVPLGILPLGTGIAVLVLLCREPSKQWFRRRHTNGVPPQYS